MKDHRLSRIGYDDALTLACKAWLMCPRVTEGTMTIKLSAWYGRIVADVIGWEDKKPIEK